MMWGFDVILLLAATFALTNGFINGGNMVSTVIVTRALEPLSALLLVAVCECAGIWILGQRVVTVLAKQTVVLPATAASASVLGVLAMALTAALIWNLSMWRLGLPSSSGHALLAALVGSVYASFGPRSVQWAMTFKVVLLMLVVPAMAGLGGLLLARGSYWVGEYLTPSAKPVFRILQIVALAGVALVHGSNDGQKSIALVCLAGLVLGKPWTAVPHGLIAMGGVFLALGVVLGSRRVLETVGKRLYRIQPLQGFCAQVSTVVCVGVSSWFGFPMSTTQVLSSSIVGAGVAIHPRAVRWDVIWEMVFTWAVTLPAVGCLAAVLARGVHHVVP